MKVEKLLKRLKVEFMKVNFIQASLDAILFFLISNLIFFLLSLQITSTIENYLIISGLTLFFFIGNLIYRIKTYHLEIYEKNNPELREVLRTARDNLKKNNTVSKALFDDVVNRARSVTSESIIPSRNIIEKIIVIGMLCFLTVGSGLIDFQLRSSTSNIIGDLGDPRSISQENNQSDVLNSSNVLGEASDINIESRELNFDITGTGESSSTDFSFEDAGRNMSFRSVEQRSSEDLELAKKYSLAIKDFS